MKLILQCFLLVLPLAVASTNLIEDTCEQTSYSELCVETLESDPSSKNADIKGLLVIVLKAAHEKAARTSEQIAKLTKSEEDPFMDQCLGNCNEYYLDAVDQIDDSLMVLESSGYSDAKMWVTAALGDAEACEEEFRYQLGYASPLTGNNDAFAKLCRIALAIMNVHVRSKRS